MTANNDVENTLNVTLEPSPAQFGFQFTRLTIVNIISNLMVPLAGLVDVAFLGHLGEIRYLTGVALATILFDYLYRSCKFLRMGTTGATAQAVGRSDEKMIFLGLLRNCFIALAVSGLILLFQYPLGELGFALLSAASEVKATGKEYYNACIWGAPAVLCNFVFIGWFLGRSKSRTVLIITIVGNLANVVLDYLFIIHYGWASTGAAVATVLSQYLIFLLAIIATIHEGWLSQIPNISNDFFDLDAMKATFSMNLDIWIRTLTSVTLFAVFIDLSSFMGTLTLASNSLMVEVVSLAVFLIEGSAFATETLAGSFYAEGKNDRLLPLLRLSGAMSLGLGLIFALVFVVFPDSMFGILTDHQEIIDKIDDYVFWLLPIVGVLSLVYVLEGYFLGLTQMSTIRDSMIWAILMGFMPLALVAWRLGSSDVLWLGLLFFMLVRCVVLGLAVPETLKGQSNQLAPTGG